MSDRLFTDRLETHLNDLDQAAVRFSRLASRSPRRSSRSPRPVEREEQPERDSFDLSRKDSRPEVSPWPVPQYHSVADLPPVISRFAMPLINKYGSVRSETELKQKIQALEDTVADYERQKLNVMGTFAEYRERVAERERKLEAEYSSKIITLSDEVLTAKKDFEARMKQFQQIQEKFDREKETALEKLRGEHQKEIQLMEQRCADSQLLNLEQKYVLEIQRLEEERKSLKTEKERLGETFESKLRRAQSLYETELTAAKALYSKELEALKGHEDALKEELLARQEEFRDRLEELQRQFQQSKEELSKCRDEVAELEKRLIQKELEVNEISKELQEARTENDNAISKLDTVENELHDTKQKFQLQEKELQEKSNMLSVLESAKSKLKTVIQDLQVEVKSLKNKVVFLENERQNLESQSDSQAKLTNSQVQALEAVLETVTKEKGATKEHYEKQLENDRSQAEEREYQIKKEYAKNLNEIEQHYNVLKEQFDQKLTEEKDNIRKTVQNEFEKRLVENQRENQSLEDEVQHLRAKLHSVLQSEDSAQKRRDTHDSKEKSNMPLTELIARTGTLRRQLDESHSELAKRQNTIDALQEEVEELKTNRVSSGCEVPLIQVHTVENSMEPEKEASQGQLKEMEEATKQLKVELEGKVREHEEEKKKLNEKIQELEEQSTNKERRNSDGDQSVQSVEDLQITVESLNSTIDNLNKRIDEMEKENVIDLRLELEKRRQEQEDLEQQLSDSQAKVEVCQKDHEHKIEELNSVIEEKDKALAEQKEAETKAREEIERELRSKFAESAAENHVADVEAFEQQLQMVKEQADQKEKEQAETISKLENDLTQKDEQVESLHGRIQDLMGEMEQITKELDKKTEEIKRFSRKTDEYIRKREEQQNQAHERKISNLVTEHETVMKDIRDKEEELRGKLDEMKDQCQPEDKPQMVEEEVQADDVSEAEATEPTEQEERIKLLETQLSDREEMIGQLQELIQSQLQQEAEAELIAKKQGVKPKGDSRKSSISTNGGGQTPLCKRAVNMVLVDRWHSLVDQLTGDATKKETLRDSVRIRKLSSGLPKSREKSPAARSDAGSDAESVRTVVSTSGSSLRPPEDRRRHHSRSPSRLASGAKAKTSTERKPAWRF